MKKRNAALVILSLATVFTAAKDLDIRYPDDRTLLIEAELGEFHAYQWYEGDRRFTRYSFDHTNNMVTDGDAVYEILQLPLAVGGRVPDIDVSVLESEATEHAFPGTGAVQREQGPAVPGPEIRLPDDQALPKERTGGHPSSGAVRICTLRPAGRSRTSATAFS
ncbi:MAG: hypothetical protein U5N26_05175 [Candidatus Marinimicrobia bacterium]|nr:hypothetical protein [Candidatus Neomarinimicrobiota bacterium]